MVDPHDGIRLRGGHQTQDVRLDRLPEFDERSRAFRAVHGIEDRPLRSYRWPLDTWLDQGSEGACTGFATAHEAAARPKPVKGITDDLARRVYQRAKALDQWPGEDYEGSSVLGAVKAGAEFGWYPEYRWAFGEADLALAVGWRGPAILGINWYAGMFEPDPDGFVAPSGRKIGGHAILCRGVSLRLGAYELHNSWGLGWGRAGRAWITREHLDRLLQEDGEACVPVVRALG